VTVSRVGSSRRPTAAPTMGTCSSLTTRPSMAPVVSEKEGWAGSVPSAFGAEDGVSLTQPASRKAMVRMASGRFRVNSDMAALKRASPKGRFYSLWESRVKWPPFRLFNPLSGGQTDRTSRCSGGVGGGPGGTETGDPRLLPDARKEHDAALAPLV